jgi:hypothetical protein
VTAASFGEVDLDLLADYVAGALDEAESRRVAELIESDSQWSHMHRALVSADAAVSEDLRAAANVELVIPDEVATRIDAALNGAAGELDPAAAPVVSLAAARARGAAGAQAGGGQAGGGRGAGGRGAGGRGAGGRGAGGRGGRRSARPPVRWQRFAAAAAVVGVLLLGLPVLAGLLAQDHSTSSPASDYAAGGAAADKAAPAEPEAARDGGAVVIYSGTDYTPSSLKALSRVRGASVPQLTNDAAKTVPAPSQPSTPLYSAESGVPPVPSGAGPVPTELARLLNPVALQACLAAVQAVTPGQVTTVDFARYEGRPALVVTIGRTPSARSGVASGVTAVVVGPACGAAGPDRLASSDQD